MFSQAVLWKEKRTEARRQVMREHENILPLQSATVALSSSDSSKGLLIARKY